MGSGAIADRQPGCGDHTLMALFRLWHRHRGDGTNPLPAMAAEATERGRLTGLAADACAQLAVACDSFFTLTEACLGRVLRPGDDDRTLSADEHALAATLRQVPVLKAIGPNTALPHGLPGALQWAAFAVLRWLDVGAVDRPDRPAGTTGCPYAAGCRPS